MLNYYTSNLITNNKPCNRMPQLDSIDNIPSHNYSEKKGVQSIDINQDIYQ